MKTTNIVVAALAGCVMLLTGYDAAVAEHHENACMEGPMAQFGRYVGDWKIDDETLAQDGSGWGPGKGARWIFECIGDGTAVQDFWHPNGGGYGTNLRTYNPDTGKWEIVWATGALNGLMHISAEQDADGNIKMAILKPEQNPPRRITFMPPHDNGWDWVMEMSMDGGETWTAVYKIKATPWVASDQR
jgi:hypothetical protein